MPATLPANIPSPNPNLSNYERSTQAFLFNQIVANAPQVGTAAPVGAKIYGMIGTVARGQLPYSYVVQVDVGGTGGLSGSLTVTLLGSLDGVNFYPLETITAPATGGIFPSTGLLARYITASVTGYSVASGAPTVSVSFSA